MRRPLVAVVCTPEAYDPDEIARLLSESDSVRYEDCVSGQYVEVLIAAGAAPLPVACVEDEQAVRAALGRADGLLLTGGPDIAPEEYGQQPSEWLGEVNPHRDALDRLAVRFALENPDLPVLGICRGIQAFNVFAGGDLIQDIPSEVHADADAEPVQHSDGARHAVRIVQPDSRLAHILGAEELEVNSFHHQAVRTPARGLVVTALAPDGVVEGLERPAAAWTVLVQWHPERMVGTDGGARRLFDAFVDACR